MKRREMNLRRRLFLAMLLVGPIFILACPARAYAYLDAGTGSYVAQILVASFLGALVAIKIFWQNIRLYMHGLISRGRQSDRKAVREE